MSASLLAGATTLLFVPATRPERFVKALAAGAGAIVIDLEDAVAPDGRDAARDTLTDAVAAMPPADRARELVRINSVGSRWYANDAVRARNREAGGGGVGGACTQLGDAPASSLAAVHDAVD